METNLVRLRHGGAALLGTLVVVLTLARCGGSGADGVVHAYLADWSAGNYRAMATLVSHPPADFVAFNRRIAQDLYLRRGTYRINALNTDGSRATASISQQLVLVPFGPLRLQSTLDLVSDGGHWRVRWSPRSIIPQLGPGDSVVTTVSWPARAAILDANGASLTTDTPMVRVGIEGARITDPSSLSAALAQAGATPAQISGALQTATAHPQWFVPVLDIPQATYEQIKPVIYPVPGTVFENFSARTGLTPALAAHVVGSVGPITAEELAALGPPYRASDTVGQTGIERAYERRLAGRPGGSIDVSSASGSPVATVARFTPRPGSPVTTTIDPVLQRDAEGALNGVSQAAALVAMKASTGAVTASVSAPSSQAFDNALSGAYPPGSTFKTVTAADLLEHGLSPSSPASCPPTITVGGATFHNFEGESQAALSLEQAFAASCNTAFIGLAKTLPDPSFASTATQFGIGVGYDMGLPAFAGKVPVPNSDAERAATSVGQANVVVSPLAMAVAAAAVSSGNLHLPRLVAGAADDTARAKPLDPTVVAGLRTMMAAVVDSPTGTAAGAGLPPGTYGKTGTAEFGTANPPQTHAWFVGYRGDVAFAVLVVGGGIGGSVAAPIAAKFLGAVGAP